MKSLWVEGGNFDVSPYLQPETVSSAYFHGMGVFFDMRYFSNYIHHSMGSFYRAYTGLLKSAK